MTGLTIITTAGSADANSYCSETAYDDYMATILHKSAAVSGVSVENKKAALIWATRLLDEQIDWNGFPTDISVQALAWPRVGMVHPHNEEMKDAGLFGITAELLGTEGYYIPFDEIPQRLIEATAELARYLIDSDTTAALATEGLAQLNVGPIGLRFIEGSPPQRKVIPDAVYQKIALWGSWKHAMTGMARLKRG